MQKILKVQKAIYVQDNDIVTTYKIIKKFFKHLNNVAASPMITQYQQIFTYNIKNCSHLITKLRFISFCHLVVFISNLLNLYI